MYIHWLQHVEFEGLGCIQAWAREHGHNVRATRFWAGDSLPEPGAMDMLVVMGGPMGVYDESAYSWLAAEKRFIRAVAKRTTPVLGICLGAQLLASVCGARITVNPNKEIGWFEVSPSAELPPWAAGIFTRQMVMFHWHGDTFELPPTALPFGTSVACRNQGFIIDDHVVGLQFHPEMTMAGVNALIEQCGNELADGPWIQTAEQMRDGEGFITAAHEFMGRLLDYLQQRANFSRSP